MIKITFSLFFPSVLYSAKIQLLKASDNHHHLKNNNPFLLTMVIFQSDGIFYQCLADELKSFIMARRPDLLISKFPKKGNAADTNNGERNLIYLHNVLLEQLEEVTNQTERRETQQVNTPLVCHTVELQMPIDSYNVKYSLLLDR